MFQLLLIQKYECKTHVNIIFRPRQKQLYTYTHSPFHIIEITDFFISPLLHEKKSETLT